MTTVRDAFEAMDYGPALEDAGPAQEWIADHGPDFDLYVDGAWRPSATSARLDALNPANGRRLATIARAGSADVDAAVAAARSALDSWRATPGHIRARYLYALARHVQQHGRLLAVLESLDNGKPIRESRDIDVPLVARHLYHHAGWAQLFETEFAGHGPVGVCGQIIPWNFPLLMLAWKVAPALAAGNTVVLKPSELTSLSALCFAGICEAVGLPPGVLSIVTGDGSTGEAIVNHPGVDKIAFTGSTEVGRLIRGATAGTGKRITLELGGKSPIVVFDDADLDSAVEGVVDAIWFNQGEVCCAGSRLLVQESVAGPFLDRLRDRMAGLRVGQPLDKTTDVGAIVAPVQLERIRALCAAGEAEGATCWQPSRPVPEEGLFFPPTLFTDVAPAATIAQEEIFGPVVVAMTFRSPDEAVALANNTRYGLAASVWSEDIGVALDVARHIKAGTVWVNSTNLFDAASGFGGVRESGFGREGGREGMWAYVQPLDDGATAVRPTTPPPTPASGFGERSEASGGGSDRPAPSVDLPSPPVDRTTKLYVGGRQVRPDGGRSRPVVAPDGRVVGLVGVGGRKDIRNAVEAARAASGWGERSGHARAQVLYFVAENLAPRADELAARIAASTGRDAADAAAEVAAAIERWFTWAAWADKWDGAVHDTTLHGLVLALREPVGVAGVVCPDTEPLLALTALVGPLVATGNNVVVVPSAAHPLPAGDLVQVLETSDLPGGVINIVTGAHADLAPVLAAHDGVDLLWSASAAVDDAEIERLAAGNLKRTWTLGQAHWRAPGAGTDRALLRQATQVKNLWLPHGA